MKEFEKHLIELSQFQDQKIQSVLRLLIGNMTEEQLKSLWGILGEAMSLEKKQSLKCIQE